MKDITQLARSCKNLFQDIREDIKYRELVAQTLRKASQEIEELLFWLKETFELDKLEDCFFAFDSPAVVDSTEIPEDGRATIELDFQTIGFNLLYTVNDKINRSLVIFIPEKEGWITEHISKLKSLPEIISRLSKLKEIK